MSCNEGIIIIENPNEYNTKITEQITKVQNPLDSMLLYLLSIQWNMQFDDKNYNPSTDVDINLLSQLYNKTSEQIAISSDNLKKFDYKNQDTCFKPTAITTLENIDSILKKDFLPIIEILKSTEGKVKKKVIEEIDPYGKSGFNSYYKSMSNLIKAQRQFDSNHKFVLKTDFLQFNF